MQPTLRIVGALVCSLVFAIGSQAQLAQPYVVYENAAAAAAEPFHFGAVANDDPVIYQHDNGTGNVNIGPPSTFDPDMLWGNYFLTQEGGEVITHISVAFGPTFPSLDDGPVTFWLLDDPDMDLDPQNATALAYVTGTPDVFGNEFFTVEIPPTQVSGAFFVGASAQLQGGQDAPARVDTSHPGDRSWFFYAPDIAEVINDLASAPFGTRMDNPEYVPFAGAFMIRAVGVPAAEPPQASVEPAELTFVMGPNETASGTVTLSNVAPEGAADLIYSAAFDYLESVLIDFEDGQRPPEFVMGNMANFVDQSGGNPGRWLRNNQLSTFAPTLYIGGYSGSPFLGNYIEKEVQTITADAQTVAAPFGVEGRPFSLVLTNYNEQPNNIEAHYRVYYAGSLAPQVGAGWSEYTFDIPSQYEGDMPEGWSGGHYGDPEGLPEGVTWQDVISQVDEVWLMWGHPAYFYLLQDFDLGVDNVGIVYRGEDGPLHAAPAEGTVAAGQAEELTVHVDTADFEEGIYTYELLIATNDPDNPLIVVDVSVEVTTVGTGEGTQPLDFALEQNYPNPFSGETTITYALAEASAVQVTVYDVAGRRVATLVDAEQEAGRHSATWDASGVAAGVYFYRIQAGDFTQTLRAMVVR